jgi:hypothetical protein
VHLLFTKRKILRISIILVKFCVSKVADFWWCFFCFAWRKSGGVERVVVHGTGDRSLRARQCLSERAFGSSDFPVAIRSRLGIWIESKYYTALGGPLGGE